MANTYTQIHIQSVFAVKYRAALLDKQWRGRLFQYMIGIMNHIGHKTLAVNGVEDHVHILYGLRPHKSISETMQMLKKESSRWINDRKSDVPKIASYIANQEIHHQKVVFIDEYRTMLKDFDVEFDERYILLPPM